MDVILICAPERGYLCPFHAAEHRRNGQKKREDCLSPQQADEFRSAWPF
jgi:hypothetical protein